MQIRHEGGTVESADIERYYVTRGVKIPRSYVKARTYAGDIVRLGTYEEDAHAARVLLEMKKALNRGADVFEVPRGDD